MKMKKVDIIQVILVAVFVSVIGATAKMFGWDEKKIYLMIILILVLNMYLDPRRRLRDE